MFVVIMPHVEPVTTFEVKLSINIGPARPAVREVLTYDTPRRHTARDFSQRVLNVLICGLCTGLSVSVVYSVLLFTRD